MDLWEVFCYIIYSPIYFAYTTVNHLYNTMSFQNVVCSDASLTFDMKQSDSLVCVNLKVSVPHVQTFCIEKDTYMDAI